MCCFSTFAGVLVLFSYLPTHLFDEFCLPTSEGVAFGASTL